MLRYSIFTALALSIFLTTMVSGEEVKNPDFVSCLKIAAEADKESFDYLRNLENQIKKKKDRALISILGQFYKITPNKSLTQEQIKKHKAKESAKVLSRKIGSIFAWDLNADMTISASERDAFTGAESIKIELLFLSADTNNDGTVSFEELHSYAKADVSKGKRKLNYESLMLFDIDQDGTVIVPEIIEAIEILESNSLNLSRSAKKRRAQRNRQNVVCTAPKPSKGSQIVVVSGYEGAALSSASVVGMDNVTKIAQIVIEPGEQPIFLFLSSYTSIIWDVIGSTERITRVVAQEGNANGVFGAGVLGVPRSKVHFVERESCIKPFSSTDSGSGKIARATVAGNLGRLPDHMFAKYEIGSISIPSGKHDKTGGLKARLLASKGNSDKDNKENLLHLRKRDGHGGAVRPSGASNVLRSLMRFHPGGIRVVKAKMVVASKGSATTYDILPEEAGLLQLLVEKKIEYTSDKYFLITEQINRFPAGLAGAHKVKFLLEKGVPMPEGSSAHSDVYSAETGKCVAGTCMY